MPVKQCPRSLKTPAGPTHTTVWDLSRRGLVKDFIQMPVSQGYKYILVMIDTFTGWTEGFPTRTEKTEGVVRKKKNCSMKSFQDLVFPGHYKVTMGHHLLLQSPKGSLKH